MIQYDTSISGGNVNPGTSLTWSHTCSGTNRLLIVWGRSGSGDGDKTTGATYNGVAMTKISQTVTSPPTGSTTLVGFYLINPASGAHNVVVSLSSAYFEAVSISYKGVRQTGFPDSINTNTVHSGTSLSVTTTTIKNNCWTTMGLVGGSSTAAGSNTTLRINNNNVAALDRNAAITPPGSTNLNATFSVGDVGGIIVSFAPNIFNASILSFLT